MTDDTPSDGSYARRERGTSTAAAGTPFKAGVAIVVAISSTNSKKKKANSNSIVFYSSCARFKTLRGSSVINGAVQKKNHTQQWNCLLIFSFISKTVHNFFLFLKGLQIKRPEKNRLKWNTFATY